MFLGMEGTEKQFAPESSFNLCLKHLNILNFHCPFHDSIGCSVCRVIDHTDCYIEQIPEVLRDYLSNHRIVQTLSEINDEIETYLEDANQDIKASYTKAVDDIRSFRKKVNDYFDRLEAEMVAEVNKRKYRDEHMMTEIAEKLKTLQKELHILEETLKKDPTKASAFTEVARLESVAYENLQESKIKKYLFKPSSKINLFIYSSVHLGQLTENSKKKLNENDGEINLKTTEDTLDCCIVSSTLISPRHIVLADYNNNCLKVIDLELGTLSTRYKLTSEPGEVTVVSRELIAVTLPEERKIQFLTVTGHNLSESHDIKVNGEVQNIACQNGNFIIDNMDKIEILSLTGNKVKTISSTHLPCISSIATDPNLNTFYVANSELDGKTATICKFDVDGKKIATYKDNTLPDVRGITVTPGGALLACKYDCNGSIHLISSDFKKVTKVLHPVKYPFCVSYCSVTNTLYVCNFHLDIKRRHWNNLKAFKLT